jgi:glycosyltransferase involved in cell wall biosynthesis
MFGAAPGRDESGGAPGVSTELLAGLAKLGHRIDCYLPGGERPLPARLIEGENLVFVWGPSRWNWNRWYSRTRLTAFVSGLFARTLASLRLRRQIVARHKEEPYDVLVQLGNIEGFAAPRRLRRTVPLVMRPDTHMAGALKGLLAERALVIRCQPVHVYVAVTAITAVRVAVQRIRIHRATLLVCVSGVFRDHLVHDYRFPRESTVVIPNPVRLDRFEGLEPERAEPPTVLVLGRISLRKGIEDVVALAHRMREREMPVRLRIVGGPSLFSDYTKLLEDLPRENAEYVPRVPASDVPGELARSDLLLQPSKYDSFGLTAAEALAAGVPVIATTEVGAIESVDESVATAIPPGDVNAMMSAIENMLERLQSSRSEMRATARREAARLFAPDVVCAQFSDTLARLVAGADSGSASDAWPA